MRTLATAALVAALTSTAGAQVPADHILVLTQTNGPTASLLLDIDPSSGLVLPVGGFPADAQAPLAVTLDPVNGDPILAVVAGSASQIIRLELAGLTVVREQTLAFVSGSCSQLGIGPNSDLLVLVDGPNGGLLRVPRRGGTPLLMLSLPRASAMMLAGGQVLTIAQSGAAGPPVVDPTVQTVDPVTGAVLFGPSNLSGFTPRQIEGVVDLVTALPRVALALSNGSLAIHTLGFPGNPGTTMPLNVTPALPPGGTIALKARELGTTVTALGNATNPFLNQTVAFGGTPPTWNSIAGPLPGNPVDFEIQYDDTARLIPYGADCGMPQPTFVFAATGGRPSLGNAAFAVGMAGGFPVAARVCSPSGQSERTAFGSPLPLPLPGGCSLLASPDLALPNFTDATGTARQPAPVPPIAALLGVTVFGQFFQAQGPLVATSQGFALQLGS